MLKYTNVQCWKWYAFGNTTFYSHLGYKLVLSYKLVKLKMYILKPVHIYMYTREILALCIREKCSEST